MALHRLENALQFLARQAGMVDQRLEIAAEDGQRRAELVGDVGHELAADHLEMLDARDVVEDEHGAADLSLFARIGTALTSKWRTGESRCLAARFPAVGLRFLERLASNTSARRQRPCRIAPKRTPPG